MAKVFLRGVQAQGKAADFCEGKGGRMSQSKSKPVPTMGAQDAPDAIYDARQVGAPKMAVFGLQHMFAMFGATILVPTLTGLSVSATLLFAGLGTLLFHLISKGKVPAFLGSSFAFIAGYAAIAPNGEADLLPYACLGVACAGLLYLLLSLAFKVFGAKRVMRFFPPVVTGPIVICIGLILAPSAIANCTTNWFVAIVAIAIIVVCNIWGRGMIRIIPILMGVIGAYIVAALVGEVDWQPVADAAWIGLPVLWDNTVFSLFGPDFNTGLAITSIITIMPLAFATIIEHIGDMSAISSTCNRNYIAEPGLHRTLLGDGLATILASLFGAPANTTYGENTGVLALTKVFDPRVIRLAAIFAIVFSFSPKFAAIIACMPACVIGGVSLVLYGIDLGGGHPQFGGEPRGLHAQPQRAGGGHHLGALAGHCLQCRRGDYLYGGGGYHLAFRFGCGLACRYFAEHRVAERRAILGWRCGGQSRGGRHWATA